MEMDSGQGNQVKMIGKPIFQHLSGRALHHLHKCFQNSESLSGEQPFGVSLHGGTKDLADSALREILKFSSSINLRIFVIATIVYLLKQI